MPSCVNTPMFATASACLRAIFASSLALFICAYSRNSFVAFALSPFAFLLAMRANVSTNVGILNRLSPQPSVLNTKSYQCDCSCCVYFSPCRTDGLVGFSICARFIPLALNICRMRLFSFSRTVLSTAFLPYIFCADDFTMLLFIAVDGMFATNSVFMDISIALGAYEPNRLSTKIPNLPHLPMYAFFILSFTHCQWRRSFAAAVARAKLPFTSCCAESISAIASCAFMDAFISSACSFASMCACAACLICFSAHLINACWLFVVYPVKSSWFRIAFVVLPENLVLASSMNALIASLRSSLMDSVTMILPTRFDMKSRMSLFHLSIAPRVVPA